MKRELLDNRRPVQARRLTAPMAPHGMRQQLLRFSLLVVLSGPSVANDDIPIDIFKFRVHGNGAEHFLRLVEKHGVLAHLRCLHDRTLVFGTITTMKMQMPGVDCANSSGEFVLRAEAYEDPPTHAFVYTYNRDNDPPVKATIERVVAALMAAAKDSSEIVGFERTCCRTSNRDVRPIMP